jgi:hypothetical protein
MVRTSTYGKNSFKYAAAVLWNDLPDDFRKISNFNQFKSIPRANVANYEQLKADIMSKA